MLKNSLKKDQNEVEKEKQQILKMNSKQIMIKNQMNIKRNAFEIILLLEKAVIKESDPSILCLNAEYGKTRNFQYLAELAIYSKLIPKKQNSVKLSNKTDWWQWQRILTMPEILLTT